MLTDRFWAKVDKAESGCWLWIGSRNRQGYGTFRVGGRGTSPALAHRVAYEALVAPIPSGMVTDHLCRVPECVNPSHIEVVTVQINTERGLAGRLRILSNTHCGNGHQWTPATTGFNKTGKRYCRPCARDRRVRYYERKRAS